MKAEMGAWLHVGWVVEVSMRAMLYSPGHFGSMIVKASFQYSYYE